MQLQLSLRRFSKDASPLLDGEPAFSEETVKINKDEVYNNLLEVNDDEFQVLTQQILEILCLVILIVLEKQCKDQLPGGKYSSPSEELTLQASSCPLSNIAPERDFAVFDNLLKAKPSAKSFVLRSTNYVDGK